jgi:hypothetical protein
VTPDETNGSDLARGYYSDVVRPLLASRWPRLTYSAGRLGSGSDVLGLDDETSRDHDWGLRLDLLLADEQSGMVAEIDAFLNEALPIRYEGRPTRFAFTGATAETHHVDVASLSTFLNSRLEFDPRVPITTEDWLSLTGQVVLEICAGSMFVDPDNRLGVVRKTLDWYPDDIWRYVVACDWIRLEEELPLMSRAGDRGDDLGSRVIAARLAHIAMHLTFLIHRIWAPYSKWFGTVFTRLPGSGPVAEALDAAVRADDWRTRQAQLARALDHVLTLQAAAGLPAASPATIPFWDRPYRQPNPAIASALLDDIVDPAIRSLPRGRGSVEQQTDTVAVLVDPSVRRAIATGHLAL